MEKTQFWAIIVMLGGGFGWIIHQMNDLRKQVSGIESRVTVIETILSMMGMPVKHKAEK